jgi:hypothetical protein
MTTETRRLVVVFAVLALAAVAVAAWWFARTARAPHLVAVRVVFRGAGETIASDRSRSVPQGVKEEVAALVSYRRGRKGSLHYLCAFSPVEVDGKEVEPEGPASWPSSGGVLRALWYSVEPALPGWKDLTAKEADKVAYKDFLANEMGRGLEAEMGWEVHADDFLARALPGDALPGGVYRVKVRVSSYPTKDDIVPTESVSSPGAADIWGGTVPTVVRTTEIPGTSAAVSRYLHLGCFTFARGTWPAGGSGWPLPLTPQQIVERGFAVTPRSVAAVAAGSDPLGNPWQQPVEVRARGDGWVGPHGRVLRWGRDVHAGDALRVGDAYFSLLADDGDGLLSLGDTVLFAWMQPAYTAPLGIALASEATTLELLRLPRGAPAP